jgi:hypothetical protein
LRRASEGTYYRKSHDLSDLRVPLAMNTRVTNSLEEKMCKRISFLVLVLLAVTPGFAQNLSPTRDQTREMVRASLIKYGALDEVNTTFRQSDKEPYNFIGIMRTGLKNVESLEIVISVSNQSTIHFRIYPHYNGGYLNLDKVKNSNGFMRKLLAYNDKNFLFWGSDDTNDVFAGYTITLESGYPEEVMRVVMRSIHNTDQFVGEMRPFIDGSAAQ